MTIAETIRRMDAAGHTRAEIREATGKSRQYVGAVLSKARLGEERRRLGLTVKEGKPKKKPPPGELASGSEGRRGHQDAG